MSIHRIVTTFLIYALCSLGWLAESHAQLSSRHLPAFGGAAWEVRLGKIPNQGFDSWTGTLEKISRGYSLRWLANASAADSGDTMDGLEDPVEHSFLGIKDGARTLLVPEGIVLTGSGGINAIRVREGDTILRFPGSFLAEKRLRELPSQETNRPVSVRVQTLGFQSIHELHPAQAASVSRLVSVFPLPDEDWSDEERRASVAWMAQLRKTSIDYVVIERVDPILGVCQIVVPIRADLLSQRASSFLERHVDAFAAIPIEASDRVTCLDSAMLATVWLPWQSRIRFPSASSNRIVSPKCSTIRHSIR